MSRLKQYDTLLVSDFERTVYPLPVHGHTYYELVYIYSGNGVHVLNDISMPYSAGDLFVISQEDQHHFRINEITRFIMIKFTDSYFKHQSHASFNESFTIVPELVMRQKLLKEIKLKFEEPYKTILHNAIDNIVLYNKYKNPTSSPFVYQQLLAIFGLIKEVILKLDERIDNGLPKKEALISYLHENIYDPQKYQARHVAAHFNISVNYFSGYFKRNFEITYRDYINNYRTKLIERRINSGQVNMKQIAAEFGFTDESHLSNYFNNHHKSRPSVLRKRVLKLEEMT